MKDYLRRISALTPEQRALLELKLKKQKPGQAASQLLPRERDGSDRWPLTLDQERLWFIHKLDPTSAVYNINISSRIDGAFDLAVFRRGVEELLRRHETLRTYFVEESGTPMQVVAPSLAVEVPVVDLRGLPADRREAEEARILKTHATLPFDLSAIPLWRAMLTRLDEEAYGLHVTMHHTITDWWSLNLFPRELGIIYSAFQAGRPSPLPELPLQYADFAVWQRRWLQEDGLKKLIDYWTNQLAGAPHVLELPGDRPRLPTQSSRGAAYRFKLPKTLYDQLKTLSRAEDATIFMTLLAAFDIVVARYSGQDDFLVGSPSANRNRPGTENLIGYFLNTLVLRAQLSDDPTASEFIRRIRRVVLDAYTHQDMPFGDLVTRLNPERDLSRMPLVQVSFVFLVVGDQSAIGDLSVQGVEGLQFTPIIFDMGLSRYDLTVGVWESSNGLHGHFEYNTDLFDEATIERLFRHFQSVLEAMVAQPDTRVHDLPLLSPEERRQLLVSWNQTTADYPRDRCVHELFEEQAAATPDAVALDAGGERLTYGELDERSNRLAHHLVSLGVSAETPVALCLERSVDLVVAMLAVLKAGGYYVPLDPGYPLERLALMLSDSGAPVVLTREEWLDALPAHWGRVVCLDADSDEIALHEATSLGRRASADNLAYVIYTSGSTGTPKGVAVNHRNISRLVLNTDYVALDASDRIAHVSNVCFDAATFEVWGALLNGAQLVIIDRETALSPRQFAGELGERGVSTMFLTTALFNQMAGEAPEGLRGLRHVLFGGEAVDAGRVRDFLREGGDPERLLHVYGPTENTTFTTWQLVAEVKEAAHTVTIGRPIANTTVYLLDARMQPVPIGVPGELYTGGEGLARGYSNRPELTAERFVPDPFGAEPGERLYRTGDLARFLPDGEIEFVGRVDNQVKVRGFRIEPGEVEAALHSHPAVAEAVVVARGEASGEKRLVAYLVCEEEREQPTAAELREHLGRRLPEYMIPSAFVSLAELPLTASGKVDRRALPEPKGMGEVARAEQFVAPRTVTEELMCGIWGEVLRVGQVGVADNFFDLGGHSLLATQVLSRVRETFGMELPLRHVFELPTVAGFAAEVEAARMAQTSSVPPPIVPVPREQSLPLSFSQQRLWFIEQLQPGAAVYNMPIALRLTGRLDLTSLDDTLTEIVRRHEVLRTTLSVENARPVQVVHPPEPFSWLIRDLTGLDEVEREAEARRLATQEAQKPFDLANGPMLRATLLRLGDEDHIALLTMHHIASDGWSLGVLVREVVTLYEAFSAGRPSPLPDLSVQYADFAVWQREWLRGEELERQVGYWRGQLAGAPPVMELPTDRPRTALQSLQSAAAPLELSASLTDALRALSRREGATLFMTLLAGWQTLLARYSGQDEVVVGAPIAGRNRAEVEPLIGFFVNTLALRADLSADPTFSQLVRQVRETCLGAYAHQDVPFEKLVEELAPARSLSHSPLFQVTFALQSRGQDELRLAGLEVRGVEQKVGGAKFDLALTLVEGAGGDGEPAGSAASGGLVGDIGYTRDLFDAATARQMAADFVRLLEIAVAAPDQPVLSLPLLSEGQQAQLREWNETGRESRQGVCVHELLEEQAKRTPETVALVFGTEQVSYRELNRRANRLARHLRTRGVGVGATVGVLLERSPALVEALLGIWKAGGVYVPLDPEQPVERVRFMLGDAGVRVVLTREGWRGMVSVEGDAGKFEVVSIDGEREEIAGHESDDLRVTVRSEESAYIIYTSGSTGQPRGVLVEHRQLMNTLAGAQECFGFNAEDVMACLAPFTFDISLLELLSPLLAGGRVLLAEARGALDDEVAARLLDEVTFLHAVPSLMRHFVAAARRGASPGRHAQLRGLFVGGDAVSPELVAGMRDVFPAARIFVGYGPTEVAIMCAQTEVAPDARVEHQLVGAPMANVRLRLCDRRGQAVPVGVVGEIYVAGAGVARGYVNLPELTAERFVEADGERWYRTGDLGRWLRDGVMVFAGRADNQVKVRGFRVEVGEVEATLREHGDVLEAAVVAREEASGEKRLVAYIACGEGSERPTPAELREHLGRRLPEYMIPSAFAFLTELPLTPSGKVDRRALPEPEAAGAALGTEYVAPRTTTEEVLAGIWGEVLSVERVSVTDNFFDLGGHSLLATQLLSRVREAFGVEVPLRSVFGKPTVEGMAAAVEGILIAEIDRLTEDEAQARASQEAG